MGIRNAFVLIGLVFAPLASGCLVIQDDVGDVLGTNLDPKTTLGIEVVADGSGKTHVSVCASDGELLCKEINGPFTASNGGAAVDLPFVVDYVTGNTEVGQFEGDLSGDAENMDIAVKSKLTQASDVGSTVKLPAAPVISSPAAGATFSAATDTIDLAWAPSGQTDRLEWTYAYTCPSTMSASAASQGPAVDDTGKLSIKAADFGLPAGESCEVEIILRRARDGQIETALKGHGGITAKQIRSVKVTVGP